MASDEGVSARTLATRWLAPSPELVRLLAAAVLIGIGGTFLLEGLARFVSIDFQKEGGQWDAAVDYRAAGLFWQGISPYTPEGLKLAKVAHVGFGHPPTTPFWFLPLAHLPYVTMAQIVAWVGLSLTLAQIWIGVRELRCPSPMSTTVLAFGVIAASEAALEHARVVQLSAWIGFAYALSWSLFRRGRDFAGGLVLGCACSLKLFPGLVVVFLLFHRRFRAVLGASVAFLVVATVMASRWGVSAWLLFFQQQGAIADRWLGHVRNASLQGILRRLLTPLCGAPDIDERTLKWVTTSVVLLVAGLAAWLLFRAARRRRDAASFDLAFVFVCVLSVFLNPWVWEHYSAILVLPVVVAAHEVASRAASAWRAWQRGEVSLAPVLRAASALVGGSLALALVVQSQFHEYQSTVRAWTSYCQFAGAPEVKAWLHREAQYLIAATWSPWLLVLFVLAFLLLFRPAQVMGETPLPR